MNKKLFMVAVVLALFIIFGLLIPYFSVKDVVQFYEAGEKTVNRPGCGFYVQIKSDRKDKIERYEDETKLFLLTLDLYEYREQEIPSHKLEELEEFLKEAKSRNVKCIFRAAYGFDQEESNDADSLERIEAHIGQIAPIINDYKEQIVCVQAGLFGPWGEWHSSKYLEGEQARKNRYWLTNVWLENLDSEMVVALRRPSFIKEVVEDGAPIERIGLHNDGLLGSETDLGTYEDEICRTEELQWLQDNLVTGYNGGEMPYVNEYSQAEQVLREFPQMKVSYLNMKYNEAVYEDWKKQSIGTENAYEYIAKRLGYRLYVSTVKCPEKIDNLILLWNRKITITLVNEGFAPLCGKYSLEWVIEDREGNLHTLDAEASINAIGYQESMDIALPVWKLHTMNVQRIGIRIYDENEEKKDNDHCIELVNDTFEYQNGVNYFLKF